MIETLSDGLCICVLYHVTFDYATCNTHNVCEGDAATLNANPVWDKTLADLALAFAKLNTKLFE
jgi:hypothetical protein